MNPLASQVGGDHYKRLNMQPIEFAHVNQLPPCIFSAVKYICRYDVKGKPVEDLKKAIHFCELQLELDTQYPNRNVRQDGIQALNFCRANEFSDLQTTAICKLAYYLEADRFTRDQVMHEAIDTIHEMLKSLIS